MLRLKWCGTDMKWQVGWDLKSGFHVLEEFDKFPQAWEYKKRKMKLYDKEGVKNADV